MFLSKDLELMGYLGVRFYATRHTPHLRLYAKGIEYILKHIS